MRARAIEDNEDDSDYSDGDEDDSDEDGNGGGKDKCSGMASRTGCTNHGAMGNIGSIKTIRNNSSFGGRRRSGVEDTVRCDSGIVQAPIDEIQCMGCDETQHSIGISDERVGMRVAGQGSNEMDSEEDTSGSSAAGEDDASDTSSDSDDSMSSRMTEVLMEKRFNKKGKKVNVNDWFDGSRCGCTTGMRRGFMCGQGNPRGQYGDGDGHNVCLGCRPVREINGDLMIGDCQCECDACHIDGDDPCGCPACSDGMGEKCYCSVSEDDM